MKPCINLSQVQEIEIDYSTCFKDAPTSSPTSIPSHLVSSSFKKNSSSSFDPGPPTWQRRDINETYPSGQVVPTVQCTLTFGIENDLSPPVLFYYKLTNFYQNHRRYAKSFSSSQLSGDAVSAGTIKGGDCDPLDVVKINGTELPYYPCGLAANSQFNDTFSTNLVLLNAPAGLAENGSSNYTYVMQNSSDIAWSSDKSLYGPSKYDWSQVAVPPNWVERYGFNYSDEEGHHPDLVNDAQFQVWMRLAGLPTFSKLAQRNDDDTMRRGTYSVDINHRLSPFSFLSLLLSTHAPLPPPKPPFSLPPSSSIFPPSHPTIPSPKLTPPLKDFNVTEYGGTKSILISTRTIVGGKNPFLGIAYVVVGGLCIVLGAIFTVTHLIKPRKLGDHTYLSWNNDAQPTASASGREGGGR